MIFYVRGRGEERIGYWGEISKAVRKRGNEIKRNTDDGNVLEMTFEPSIWC